MQGLKLLLLVELGLALVGLPGGYLLGADLLWSVTAWVVCFLSTLVAYFASQNPKGVEFVMLRMATGMVCRTLLPIGLAIWGLKQREPPVGPIEVLVLVLFYLGGLVVDVYLSVQSLQHETPAQQRDR